LFSCPSTGLTKRSKLRREVDAPASDLEHTVGAAVGLRRPQASLSAQDVAQPPSAAVRGCLPLVIDVVVDGEALVRARRRYRLGTVKARVVLACALRLYVDIRNVERLCNGPPPS